jgi:hypothetical protein
MSNDFNKTTLLMDILLRIRRALVTDVESFADCNYTVAGLRQRIRYSDGKLYEITIKEMPDEKRND